MVIFTEKEFGLASIASTATVLIRYASPETFDWSAYLVHGTTFIFSFSMLGLLATDLAFTLRNREVGDSENQKSFNGMMDWLWGIIYWGNFIQGSFVTKFFKTYWVNGHFSVGARVKATLRTLLVMMIAGLLFLAVVAIAGYYLVRDYLNDTSFSEVGKTAILVLSNVYGTLVLVILLSYGLAFLPFSVWKRSNNE